MRKVAISILFILMHLSPRGAFASSKALLPDMSEQLKETRGQRMQNGGNNSSKDFSCLPKKKKQKPKGGIHTLSSLPNTDNNTQKVLNELNSLGEEVNRCIQTIEEAQTSPPPIYKDKKNEPVVQTVFPETKSPSLSKEIQKNEDKINRLSKKVHQKQAKFLNTRMASIVLSLLVISYCGCKKGRPGVKI